MDSITCLVGPSDLYRRCSACGRFAKVVVEDDGESRCLCFACSTKIKVKDPDVVMRATCSNRSCSNAPRSLVKGIDFGEGHLYLCDEHLDGIDFSVEYIVALPGNE